MKKSLILPVFACFSMLAMENTPTPKLDPFPPKSGAFINTLTQAIDNASANAQIYIESPFFSNVKVINALRSCAQRGCDVHLLLKRKSPKIESQFKQIEVDVTLNPTIHTKRYIVLDGDKSIAFQGSDNCSQTSQFSHEVIQATHDPQLIERLISYFNADKQQNITRESFYTPEKRPKPETTITPRKTTVRGTPHKLIPFKLERFEKLQEASSGALYIASMTCNHPELVDRIVSLDLSNHPTKSVTLVLDRTALTNKDLLDRMHRAGAQIYIYNQDKEKLVFNKFPALQHSKLFLRKIGDTYLSIVSTGNWTTQSMNEHNSDILSPDKDVFEKLYNKFELIKSECRLYNPDEEKE